MGSCEQDKGDGASRLMAMEDPGHYEDKGDIVASKEFDKKTISNYAAKAARLRRGRSTRAARAFLLLPRELTTNPRPTALV